MTGTIYLTFICLGAIVAVGMVRRIKHLTHALQSTRDTVDGDMAASLYHRISAEHADTGLVVQALNGTVIWANPGYLKMVRRSAKEVIGHTPFSYAFPPGKRPPQKEIDTFRLDPADHHQQTSFLRENVRGDGTPLWLRIKISYHDPDGDNPLAVLVCHDVTEEIARETKLRKTSEKLAHIASHDHLTAAANRAELARFVDDALQAVRQNNTGVGILHIDLDNFKQVNDTHGHSAGDAVLVAVADRLRAHIRDTDLLARIGGDEFVIACPGLHNLSELQSIGTALVSAVNRPVVWQNKALTCQISIGAALSNDAIQSADEMLLQSDFALYDVKRSGRGRVATYNRQLHERHVRETALAAELQLAVRNKELTFHHQPVVGMTKGDIRGFEALVRWNHPRNGPIHPTDFLPVAQSMGLMADIDFMAMEAAMDFKLRLNAAHHTGLRTAFNTSPEVLSHPQFMKRLCRGLKLRRLAPADIIIEVLETVVFDTRHGETPLAQAIADLDAAGFVTVLDDFGSGHAGLAHLAKLAIKGVKIDHTLTKNLLTDPTTDKIFGMLIGLCNDLNLKVATEGVESAEQVARLATLGSSSMQGNWIAKPMPADAALAWADANTDCPRRTVALTKGQLIA